MTQPEAMKRAIKLALRLECAGQNEAAAELRRLYESNQELIAALKEMLDGENKSFRELCEQARAAIAKGEAK